MQVLRQVGGSLLLALFSIALVTGGISLALAEVYVPDSPTPTETQEHIPVFNSPTPQSAVPVAETPTPSPSATIPTSTACPPPANWIPIMVQSGDDLVKLALLYKTTPDEISRANCLFSANLKVGSYLYVPPVPTPTPVSCGPPAGWVRYTVRVGDTLYSLSHAYNVSLAQLRFANCIPSNQSNINAGQSLWVPFVTTTRTPPPTATATLTPVSIIFPTITRTSTNTLTATTTPTGTMIPTSTATSTATATPTLTATVASPTKSPTATATPTGFPTGTSSP